VDIRDDGGAKIGEREKLRVALSSLLGALALTSAKLVVGLTTGSLGLLSEAAHSGLDLVAAALTLWAVRASARPPDADHPYGHGKIENFSALLETGLLLATCVWVAYEAVERLFFRDVPVQVTPWSFAVVLGSIVVDVSRSRALARAARAHRSMALEADALHFSTDVASSVVVLAGLALVLVARRTGLGSLAKADAIAALGVAGISVWVSLRLGKRSVDELLDTVPPQLADEVARAAHVLGVEEVARVRLRRSGPDWFVDVTLRIRADVTFDQAHAACHAAERAILGVVPRADVVVHADPAPAPVTADRE
jgi:cation diffusion facilitator family transporter